MIASRFQWQASGTKTQFRTVFLDKPMGGLRNTRRHPSSIHGSLRFCHKGHENILRPDSSTLRKGRSDLGVQSGQSLQVGRHATGQARNRSRRHLGLGSRPRGIRSDPGVRYGQNEKLAIWLDWANRIFCANTSTSYKKWLVNQQSNLSAL